MNGTAGPRDLPREAALAAILTGLPVETSTQDRPLLSNIYVPLAHAGALEPNNMIVVGMRGSGKTFWWYCLLDEEYRRQAARSVPEIRSFNELVVTAGFGQEADLAVRPDRDTLDALMAGGMSPRAIWRAVLIRHLQPTLDLGASWAARVEWVARHPEEVSALLYAADRELVARAQTHLVIFDALDRCATSREDRSSLISGLCQLAVDLRPTRRIRIKVFVRPDMLDPLTMGFPDSSKLYQTRKELDWPTRDLFGLLWHQMANAESAGEAFREAVSRWLSGGTTSDTIDTTFKRSDGGPFLIPRLLRNSEERQRALFRSITGKWSQPRSHPYTWLPNRLADGNEKVSPRSFLTAIRRTAERSQSQSLPSALPEAILREAAFDASDVRWREMVEDFPWLPCVVRALAGLEVPLDREQIYQRWGAASLMQNLPIEMEGLHAQNRNLPKYMRRNHPGILEELIEIGLASEMTDGRINVPELFRHNLRLRWVGGIRHAN